MWLMDTDLIILRADEKVGDRAHNLQSFHFNYLIYEGVSKSVRNHPKVKAPDISFLHFIHRTSLKSHYTKLHFGPTMY